LKEKRGINLQFICLEKIHPIEKSICQLLSHFENILIVEDHRKFGSLYEDLLKLKVANIIKANLFGINLEESCFTPGRLADVEIASGHYTATII